MIQAGPEARGQGRRPDGGAERQHRGCRRGPREERQASKPAAKRAPSRRAAPAKKAPQDGQAAGPGQARGTPQGLLSLSGRGGLPTARASAGGGSVTSVAVVERAPCRARPAQGRFAGGFQRQRTWPLCRHRRARRRSAFRCATSSPAPGRRGATPEHAGRSGPHGGGSP